MQAGREIKGRDWDVERSLREDIQHFKTTLPLIQDLKNPGMRDRHWKKVIQRVATDFNPYGDDFTLETIASLGLYNHAEFISSLSSSATKEYQIEQGLDNIEKVWLEMAFEILPHREAYMKVNVPEDLFTFLEDHQVIGCSCEFLFSPVCGEPTPGFCAILCLPSLSLFVVLDDVVSHLLWSFREGGFFCGIRVSLTLHPSVLTTVGECHRLLWVS